MRSRFRGSVLAAACGDALGMPTENISKKMLREFYNGKVTSFQNPQPDHPCSHLHKGQWTDDTQQYLLLAQSLVEYNGFNPEDFAQKIGLWAWRCEKEPGYDRWAGQTSLSAGMKLRNRVPYTKSGSSSATCGSSMRTGPLGLFYHNQPDQLTTIASTASSITHTNPLAIDAAVFTSHMIANLARGETPKQATIGAYNQLRTELKNNIYYVIVNRKIHPTKMAQIIGSSQAANETIPMALHCFLHSPDSLEETLINGANLVPGDTDSIACIAGAFSGAHNGYEAIPERWSANIEEKELLLSLADQLFEGSLQ